MNLSRPFYIQFTDAAWFLAWYVTTIARYLCFPMGLQWQPLSFDLGYESNQARLHYCHLNMIWLRGSCNDNSTFEEQCHIQQPIAVAHIQESFQSCMFFFFFVWIKGSTVKFIHAIFWRKLTPKRSHSIWVIFVDYFFSEGLVLQVKLNDNMV
jgi:hypothetical protein